MNFFPPCPSPEKSRKPNPRRRRRVIPRGPATLNLSVDGTRSVSSGSSTELVRDTTQGGRLKVTCMGLKVEHAVIRAHHETVELGTPCITRVQKKNFRVCNRETPKPMRMT